jgi:hypothetical protein
VHAGALQAATDEYGFLAATTPPAESGSATTPWTCLNRCDGDASCLAVFMHKTDDWGCWVLDGDTTVGTVVSAIKANPRRINHFEF